MIESHILVMIKIFKYFASFYNFHLTEKYDARTSELLSVDSLMLLNN